MSTNVSAEQAREALRRQHGVRLVAPEEEGAAAGALPAGVYGFTASPILASPLFADRRYRNFEVHRLANAIALVGFVTPDDAARLSRASAESVSVRVFPDAEGDAAVILSIPYDRIAQHRQYAVRNAEAVTLHIASAHALTA